MYQQHPHAKSPSSPDAKIWRFMDLSKFISLLAKKALFFSRADEMQDPYECLPSVPTLEHYRVGEDVESNIRGALEMYRNQKRFLFINCWHMNEYESAAMWKLYLKSDEGVAIETTFANFRDAFEVDGEHKTYIGEVEYADYALADFGVRNLFYTFLHKRRSFEHEKELRALVSDYRYLNFPGGIYIPVDLKVLIGRVFVLPVAPSWFDEVVRSVAAKYDIDDSRVTQSDLYRLVYPTVADRPEPTGT